MDGSYDELPKLLLLAVPARMPGNAVPLIERDDLLGWPCSFGGEHGAQTPYRYLQALPRQLPWLETFFQERDYQRGLRAYSLFASAMELARRLATGGAAIMDGPLLVPPVFLLDQRMAAFDELQHTAFPTPDTVEALARATAVNARELRSQWPIWIGRWRTWLEKAGLASPFTFFAQRVTGLPALP